MAENDVVTEEVVEEVGEDVTDENVVAEEETTVAAEQFHKPLVQLTKQSIVLGVIFLSLIQVTSL